MQAEIDKIIWFCIDTDKSLACTEIRDQASSWGSLKPVTWTGRAPAQRCAPWPECPPQQGFTLGQVSPALCPRNALVSQCWDSHGRLDLDLGILLSPGRNQLSAKTSIQFGRNQPPDPESLGTAGWLHWLCFLRKWHQKKDSTFSDSWKEV